jgi:hypothetical protein
MGGLQAADIMYGMDMTKDTSDSAAERRSQKVCVQAPAAAQASLVQSTSSAVSGPG